MKDFYGKKNSEKSKRKKIEYFAGHFFSKQATKGIQKASENNNKTFFCNFQT